MTFRERRGRRRGCAPSSAARHALGALFALLLAASCGGGGAGELAVDAWSLEPAPPRVGDTRFELELRDAAGAPLEGAQVRVEGNMNHAGMVPVFADAREAAPGRYVGELELSMGGDWFLVVRATTAEGERLERVLDLPGVASRAEAGPPGEDG